VKVGRYQLVQSGIPVAAVLVVLVAAVATTAAIPDANGVIHGCRNTKSGALRVIDANTGQTCSKDEAALNWEAGQRPRHSPTACTSSRLRRRARLMASATWCSSAALSGSRL
jgi:hypothetical protein